MTELIDVLSECGPGSSLAGRQGFFSTVSEMPTKTGDFRVSGARRAICCVLILSLAFVLSHPFYDFPSAMTLTMTLAERLSENSYCQIL